MLVNDLLLLLAVVYHALNGLRMVVLDWGFSRGARRVFDVVLWLVGVGAVAFGTWALWPWVELRGPACRSISSSSSAAGSPGCAPRSRPRPTGLDVAILSQVHPGRSHSGAAQGGINAALANHPDGHDDTPEKHAFDTVKG